MRGLRFSRILTGNFLRKVNKNGKKIFNRLYAVRTFYTLQPGKVSIVHFSLKENFPLAKLSAFTLPRGLACSKYACTGRMLCVYFI